jgi:hypothetical protein
MDREQMKKIGCERFQSVDVYVERGSSGSSFTEMISRGITARIWEGVQVVQVVQVVHVVRWTRAREREERGRWV